MALTIICVCGTSYTGKSTTIRAFTERYLRYGKDKGDVLGVFPMPRRYAVGVSGAGDHRLAVRNGLQFLDRYMGLRVMIVACHTEGATRNEVERFKEEKNANIHYVYTGRIVGVGRQNAAIATNILKIKRYMPAA